MQNYSERKQEKLEPVGQDGIAFLKVATSAPDFESLAFDGIPDDHTGPTVVVKQYVSQTVTALAGKATYFICTPQADVAYWATDVNTGDSWINGQGLIAAPFPKADQVFESVFNLDDPSTHAGGSNTGQISSGRLVSSAAELEVLNNAFNQYGSITAWKVPLQTVDEKGRTGSPAVLTTGINGISGLISPIIGSQSYTSAVRRGCYSVSMNRQDEFDFHPVRDAETLRSNHSAFFGLPGLDPGTRAIFNGPLCLWDNNFDTIVFRVDVPAAVANQSFLLKRWITYEAQPVFNSLLWDTSHQSPRRDEAALCLYREMSRQLPMAVPQKDNPDFWKFILDAVDEVSNVLSYVPGPVGMTAKGVHALVGLLDNRPKNRKGKTTRKRAKGKRKKKKG